MYNKIDPNIIADMDHLSADSLILKMSIIENKPKEIWKLIEKHYGKDFLKGVAQYEYGLSQTDMNNLFEQHNEQIEVYKQKTLAKMARVWEESEQEICRLRRDLDERNLKHAQLEAKYLHDIKKVQISHITLQFIGSVWVKRAVWASV